MSAWLVAALVLAPGSSPPTASCPVDGIARLGRSRIEMRGAAREALGGDSEPRCRTLALATLDWLDLQGEQACAAWHRLEDEPADADLHALRGALAWRCGDLRAAHREALAALADDEQATAAWTLLGRLLAARFLDRPARQAFDRALDVDPGACDALLGRASVTQARAERISFLRRFVSAALQRGDRRERVRAALESIEFTEALGDREVFVLDRAELPGQVSLRPIASRPGEVSGWVIRIRAGDAGRLPALFDTGAAGLHLDARAARKARLEALSDVTLVGGGGKGEHEVSRGVLPTLDLGPIAFREALALAAMDSLHPQGVYRAILGADLFSGTALAFDFPHRRLDVFEASAPRDGPADPRAVDPWPRRAGVLPLVRIAGMLLVPVELEAGQVRARRLMLFDTGASRTMIDAGTAAALDGLHFGTRHAARGYGGAIRLVGTIPLLRVRVATAGEVLKNVPVFDLSARSKLTGVNVGGFLGNDWLSRRRVTLDLARGELVVEQESRGRRRRR